MAFHTNTQYVFLVCVNTIVASAQVLRQELKISVTFSSSLISLGRLRSGAPLVRPAHAKARYDRYDTIAAAANTFYLAKSRWDHSLADFTPYGTPGYSLQNIIGSVDRMTKREKTSIGLSLNKKYDAFERKHKLVVNVISWG